MSKKLFCVHRHVHLGGTVYVYADNDRKAKSIAGDFECDDYLGDEYDIYEENSSIPKDCILNPEDKEEDND